MEKIKASCLMTTYGRVDHVQRALRYFLDQDYPDKELIIVNSFDNQKLRFDHPNVKVINLDVRPSSLGACRNLAVKSATGDLMITWDDDDAYLPNHIANFVENFDASTSWIWFENQFYSEKGIILKFMSGSYNTFAFTKKKWEEAGGYNELSVGEDKHFVGRCTSISGGGFSGKKITLAEDKISFIYCWNNFSFHVSGQGEDRKGIQPAYDRVADDLKRRIRCGLEKTGDIQLVPAPSRDLKLLVEDFMERNKPQSNIKPVCIVMLGRYGDICQLLPICRHIAENYARPHLMVAREFASILDGVSYVIPEVVDIPYDRLEAGLSMACRKFPLVLRGQIYGKGFTPTKNCASYNEESWDSLGFLKDFHNKDFELVFDRRDSGREQQLVSKLKTGKPMLLVQMGCNNTSSSPFPFGAQLLEIIRQKFSETLNVVDLSAIKSERIYDILGLMDEAVGLVSCDSSALHLAAAAELPVVAVVNPLPWAGSTLRCNGVARLTYTEAEKDPQAVIQAIQIGIVDAMLAPKTFQLKRRPVSKPPTVRIFHAVEIHEDANVETTQRKASSLASWDALYADGSVLPAHYHKYERSALSIGDKRDLPFLKDVLKFAMDQADDDDQIFWTNDDNILHPDLPSMLRFYVSVYGAVCSQRCEFRRGIRAGMTPDEWVKAGEHHMGRDLFAFKKSWLVKHWDEIPDYLLGASAWDLAMACFIRLSHGIITTRRNIEHHIFPAEMLRGFIGHTAHKSYWNRADNQKSPSELWNKKLFHTWASKNLPELKFTENLDI